MATLAARIHYTPTARAASFVRRFSRRGYRIHLVTECWATTTQAACAGHAPAKRPGPSRSTVWTEVKARETYGQSSPPGCYKRACKPVPEWVYFPVFAPSCRWTVR
jgi:hypothetical protein